MQLRRFDAESAEGRRERRENFIPTGVDFDFSGAPIRHATEVGNCIFSFIIQRGGWWDSPTVTLKGRGKGSMFRPVGMIPETRDHCKIHSLRALRCRRIATGHWQVPD
jgi:hypothetical protein